MNIENLGRISVTSLGKRRFAKLPKQLKTGTRKQPLSAIRFPHLALYTLPDDATAYYKKVIARKRKSVPEHQTYLRILYNSMLQTVLERSKPLEVPDYLSTDKAGQAGCLRITSGPGLLALYKPDKLLEALHILCLSFGKIIYTDENIPLSLSMNVDKGDH